MGRSNELGIMPPHALVWRFNDGTVGIDFRLFGYLSPWLAHDEVIRLCYSLSPFRVVAFDYLMRHVCP